MIDEIIGDNFPEEIHYYYKSAPDEVLPRRDPTFSYEDFVSATIEEMRKISFQGGGSKTPGIWRDKGWQIKRQVRSTANSRKW